MSRLYTQDISAVQVYKDKPDPTTLTSGDIIYNLLAVFDHVEITMDTASNPGRGTGEWSRYPIPFERGYTFEVATRIHTEMNGGLLAMSLLYPLGSYWLWLFMAPAAYGDFSYLCRAVLNRINVSAPGEGQMQTATFESQGDLLLTHPS